MTKNIGEDVLGVYWVYEVEYREGINFQTIYKNVIHSIYENKYLEYWIELIISSYEDI